MLLTKALVRVYAYHSETLKSLFDIWNKTITGSLKSKCQADTNSYGNYSIKQQLKWNTKWQTPKDTHTVSFAIKCAFNITNQLTQDHDKQRTNHYIKALLFHKQFFQSKGTTEGRCRIITIGRKGECPQPGCYINRNPFSFISGQLKMSTCSRAPFLQECTLKRSQLSVQVRLHLVLCSEIHLHLHCLSTASKHLYWIIFMSFQYPLEQPPATMTCNPGAIQVIS